MSFQVPSNNVEIKTSDETNNSLNELFQVVYDNQNFSRQKPLAERQLPLSFFVPPTGINSSTNVGAHYKAFSSPATLEETYRAGHALQMTNHSKQLSLDSQNGTQHYSETNNLQNLGIKSESVALANKPHLDIEVKKLPEGYEMSVNDKCQVYFLNHKDKVTTWFDPRLPEEIQKWGMTLSELQELHMQYLDHLSASHATQKHQNLLSKSSPHHHHHQQQHQQETLPHHSHSHSSIGTHGTSNRNIKHRTSTAGFTDLPKTNVHLRSISQPVSSSGTSLGLSHLMDSSSSTLNNHYQPLHPPPHHNPHIQAQQSQQQQQHPQHQFFYQQEYNNLNPRHYTTQKSNSNNNNSNNSSSHNSSCSNLSSCLNGLNLSSSHHSPYTPSCQISPAPNNLSILNNGINIAGTHNHQDSLDSGVGQSVISNQTQPNNTSCNNNDQKFIEIKIEDRFNLDGLDDKTDDHLMDIEVIRTLNL